MKETKNQSPGPRKPRQQRSQNKVELILEAAVRLLAKGGLGALTTNAVAETAGVSIGTLYQYFANKAAILDALAEHEMAALSQRVLSALQEPGEMTPEDRIVRVIRAVTSSYGGRQHVHRIVSAHSLAHGGGRLKPLIEQLVALLSTQDRPAGAERSAPLSPADAFVLTNAFAGVMRARIQWQDEAGPPADQIDQALVRLIVNFAGDRRGA